MKSKLKHVSNTALVGLALVLFSSTGCNRAAMRVPGASTAFPETAIHYTAKTRVPYALIVATPTDLRTKHYGERVAGTKWTSSSTDALWNTDVPQMIQERLVKEFTSSGLFAEVTTRPPTSEDVVLRTEIHVFSSQARGFLFVRVVGMSALRVSLERNGKIISEDKFERVVTDADKEYTGSQVSFIEQAMRVTMADSLRELMKEMLQKIEVNVARWDGPSNK